MNMMSYFDYLLMCNVYDKLNLDNDKLSDNNKRNAKYKSAGRIEV